MMDKKTLLIKNARAVLQDGITDPICIHVENGRIKEIGSRKEVPTNRQLDVEGSYVFPGFIDVHVHGGGGSDFMDGTAESFETVVKTHLQSGTTTMIPTAMTASREELRTFIRSYHEFKSKSDYADLVCGMHLEGPYFSKANGKSKGAQSGSLIRDIDFAEVEEMLALAEGEIVRWDAAPEVPGSFAFAELMKKNGILCAVAHTNATADEAQNGFAAGFSHVTHFYNAVTAYMKRDQIVTAGVVEAAYLDEKVTVELICDGQHVPKQCLQLALKIKGVENVIGITDATRIAGTGVKSGKLGSLKNGTDVIVDDGVAQLPELSSYAGSICTMGRALRILCVEYGVDPVTAAKMLSTNPARQIGIRDQRGAIEESMLADFVITDHEFKILTVIKEGEIINN